MDRSSPFRSFPSFSYPPSQEHSLDDIFPYSYLFSALHTLTVISATHSPHTDLSLNPNPLTSLLLFIAVNRVLGEITRERLAILRLADDIMIQEITAAGVYREIGQAFVVLLPVKSVGVMGDCRTYEQVRTYPLFVGLQGTYIRGDM